MAHYRKDEGYLESWYDQENDDGGYKTYFFVMPDNDGDIYLSIETYNARVYPDG